MNSNQQFSVSCHIMAILADSPQSVVTSEAIAASVNTHPVVIRRIMSHLRLHGLVESRPGQSGGWRLTRPASQISLREVFQAVSHESVLSMHQHPDPDCIIGGHIQEILSDVFKDAQEAFEQVLGKISVAHVLEQTLRANSKPGGEPLDL